MDTCESDFDLPVIERVKDEFKRTDKRKYNFTHNLHTLDELIANGPVEFWPDPEWDEFQLKGTIAKEITGSPILYGARLYIPPSVRARKRSHLVINIIPDTARHAKNNIYHIPEKRSMAYRFPVKEMEGPYAPITRAGIDALDMGDDEYSLHLDDEPSLIAELARIGWVSGMDQLQILSQSRSRTRELVQPISITAILDNQWTRRQYIENESDAWDMHFPYGNSRYH